MVEKLQASVSRCLQSAVAANHSDDPSTFAKLLIKISDLRTLNTIHSEKLLGTTVFDVLLIFVAQCCKGKGKGLDTCYSAAYMSQTRDQQRFTISKVAADWHEPMVLQCIMWPSIARANRQLDPWCS